MQRVTCLIGLIAALSIPPVSGADNLNIVVAAAVADTRRPDADRLLDERRKPGEVLSFFGIKPGMQVLDVFGGGGYYAELAAYVVGSTGRVTLYNNAAWDGFVGNAVTERLADGRLANVVRLVADPLDLPADGRYDMALCVLGMHDVYYTDTANGWPAIDRAGFFRAIFESLAPGGVLGIVDHSAVPGTDPADVSLRLHRIDEAVLRRDIEAAGFRFEASAGMLRNPGDARVMSVFDQSMRWRTDRFVLRFRKGHAMHE